jgi:hypothetical protein
MPKAMVNLVVEDDGEATLLMATFYALHDVEPEAGELAARTKEAPGRGVFLDEPRTQVHLGTKGSTTE